MADAEGFLIIDEVPAVGMMRSTHNFVAAGAGGATHISLKDQRSLSLKSTT
jgi:beta-glucuronidase